MSQIDISIPNLMPKTRKAAIAVGSLFYDNGRMCKSNHGSVRRTKDARCVECQYAYTADRIGDPELLKKLRETYHQNMKDPVKKKNKYETRRKWRGLNIQSITISKWVNGEGIKFISEDEAINWYKLSTNPESICLFCKITCREHIDLYGQRLSLDHDHITGRPRRLLCKTCNLIEGHIVKMSKERVINLIKQLKDNINATD